MKKKILLLTALVAASAVSAQTQLDNSSFENTTPVVVDRTNYSTPGSIITYDSTHSNWVSGNEVFKDDLFGTATDEVFAKDTSDAFDGLHALLLRTHITTSTGILATGNTGLGVFEFNNNNPFNSVKQGMPFSDRPVYMGFNYKYYDNAGDSCQVSAVLTKWNAVDMKRDTVGLTNWVSTDEKTDWTEKFIAFNYENGETPDTISVLFLSSKGGFVESFSETPVGQEGATFIIDNIQMDYTAGIEDYSSDIATISSVNNMINVTLKESALIEVYSLAGSLVFSSKENKGTSTISLKQGFYAVNVRSGNSSMTKKVVLK